MKVKAFDVFGISAILIVLGLLIAIIVIGVRAKKFGASAVCGTQYQACGLLQPPCCEGYYCCNNFQGGGPACLKGEEICK